MKTVADLTFDDFRKIGKDAAEKAVADLRAAGHLASEASAKTGAEQPAKRQRVRKSLAAFKLSKMPTEQHVAKSVRRSRHGEVTSLSAEIHSSKALRYEKS